MTPGPAAHNFTKPSGWPDKLVKLGQLSMSSSRGPPHPREQAHTACSHPSSEPSRSTPPLCSPEHAEEQ